MDEPSPQKRALSAAMLADLFAEFRQPGQALDGFSEDDAVRVFAEVVQQLIFTAVRDRQERRVNN